MVLVCITGELGVGKTLTLAYLVWNNWYFKGREIYTNFTVYGIPFVKIKYLNDLFKVIPEEVTEEEILHGTEKALLFDELWRLLSCLPPNTYVISKNRIINIDTISTDIGGDTILSLDFKTGKFIESHIGGKLVRPVLPNEKLIKVCTRTREIIASKNHKFFVINRDPNFWNRHRGENPLKFVKVKPASELRKGDRVLMVSKLPPGRKAHFSRDLARLLGYVLGDGHINYFRRMIRICDKDKELLRKYKELAKRIGFTTTPIKKSPYTNSYFCHIYGNHKNGYINKVLISKIYDALEVTSGYDMVFKDIPRKIMESNNAIVAEFLGGFVDAEGHVRVERHLSKKFGRIEMSSAKRNIIEKIKHLLLRFGIDSSLKEGIQADGIHKIYHLEIRDSLSIKLFKKHIKLFSQKKSETLQKIPLNFNSKRRIFGNFEIGYVTNVEEVDWKYPYLIDLSIPVYENFIANGFVVHNSRMVGLGARQRNEIINRILMASRKAGVTLYYTTQLFSMIDKNIRNITDLLMKPQLGPANAYCKVYVYGIIEGKFLQPMQPYYFIPQSIFPIYNTYEVASGIELEGESDEEKLKPKIVPITKNPAWKKYCRDELGLDIEGQEFIDYSKKVAKELGLNVKKAVV